MRWRWLILTALVACGRFSEATVAPDGGVDRVDRLDGGLSGSASEGGAPADASMTPTDASGACEAVCHGIGGRCEGGSCMLGGVSPTPIVCPSGVPCIVTCGKDECMEGVDCGAASSCTVKCTGENACAKHGVQCGGTRCDVECSGLNACRNGPDGGHPSVECTASAHCGVACTGDGSCTEGAICTTGGDCTIACGSTTGAPKSCKASVRCTAGTTCDISCIGAQSCFTGRVSATAGTTATVTCGAGDNCHDGVHVEGAKAHVVCGIGLSCSRDIQCESQDCSAMCAPNTNQNLCCSGASCQSTGCVNHASDTTFDNCQ